MAKVVSIEVGYTFIRICEMDYRVKNPKVYHYVTVPTPPNVIEDGYLKESANLRGVIKKALSNQQITTKKVVFTVASSKILNREVMVPDVKPNMIGNLIRTNLAEYFPIDLTGYSVSHVLLEKLTVGPDAGKSRVLIVAAEKDMIAGYSTLAQSCGLTLVDLDFVGNSIYQAVKKETNRDTAMILKIDENQTIITVVKNDNLMLLRSVNYGVSGLIHEVHRTRLFNVPDEEEAWALLKKRGVIKVAFDETTRIMESDLEHDDTPEYAAARLQVTQAADSLVKSISRVISFYNSRNEEPINRIYVIGMGGEIVNLTKLFTNELGISTAVFRRLEGIGWHQAVGDSELYAYVSCIGATMNPVSFVEQEKKKGGGSSNKREFNYIPLAVLIGIASVAGAVMIAAMGVMPYREAQERETDLKEKEQTYLPAEALYNQCNAVNDFYQDIMTGDALTKVSNDNILLFLQELENTLPADSIVSEFVSTDESVIMTLETSDKETAALFIKKLRDFESIYDVEIGVITEEKPILEAEDEEADENEEAVETPEEEAETIGRRVSFTITGYYNR